MKKFIGTIKNIFAIEELRQRIIYTLGFLLIYRLGSYIVLPGVDPAALAKAHSSDEGILQLIDICFRYNALYIRINYFAITYNGPTSFSTHAT